LQPTTDVPPIENHPVDVAAFVIDHTILRRTVAKALTKSFKTEMKDSLQGVPSNVIDKTQQFALDFLPFPKSANNGSKGSSPSNSSASSYIIPAIQESAEDMEDRFQDFYQSLEDMLRSHADSPTSLRKQSHTSLDDKSKTEEKIRDTLERIERVLCSTFYDR